MQLEEGMNVIVIGSEELRIDDEDYIVLDVQV